MQDAYNRALSMNLIQHEVEQIVPLILARAGYEKRVIEAGKAGVLPPLGHLCYLSSHNRQMKTLLPR